MQPALRPGDRLLVCGWLRAKRGHVIVFRDPEALSTFVIKRIEDFTPDGQAVVRGDNPNVSRDSRQFGPVPRSLIVGRAFLRYLPAQRRGRL
jgi:nickel-type superoxide dismutase maturation protease